MRDHAIYKDYIRYIGDGYNFSELYSYENDVNLIYNKFMEYWENTKTGKFYRWMNSKDKKIIEECHKETREYFGNDDEYLPF